MDLTATRNILLLREFSILYFTNAVLIALAQFFLY